MQTSMRSTGLNRPPCCAPSSDPRARPAVIRQRVCPRGFGKDAVGGWMDLASLVSSAGSSGKSPYEELAYNIGKDVYVDVSGWHLYLRDMTAAPGLKMASALATSLGPRAASRLSESDVTDTLKQVPVKLGGGKTQVSLFEILPSRGVQDLTRILEDFGRK